MTRTCTSLDQVRRMMSEYVLAERPMNLAEMKNALDIIDAIYAPVKRISDAPDAKRNSWLLTNDWVKIRQFIG